MWIGISVGLTLFVALLAVILGFVTWQLIKARKDLVRFQSISDIEEEGRKLKAQHSSAESEHQRNMQSLQQKNDQQARSLQELQSQTAQARAMLIEVQERYELETAGFYKPRYNLLDSERYALRLKQVRDKQKALIKAKQAVVCPVEWAVNGNKREGKKQTDRINKLALSSFNTQADNIILKVSFKNIDKSEDKLHKVAANVNKLIETMSSHITRDYLKLKIEELYLAYEYAEKKEREKEEMRLHKEQLREEQQAAKELDKQLKEAAKKRKAFEDQLEKLRRQKQTQELLQRIQALEADLENAQANERAIAQAQLTKRGHVYIISNIGSFGEGVYKIGLTRRLDPMIRVKELGDASVPFIFDVHAMIWAEDAPALEKHLHAKFHDRRVNKINNRKEFFRVSLKEIENELVAQGLDVELKQHPDAKEYWQSVGEEGQMAA